MVNLFSLALFFTAWTKIFSCITIFQQVILDVVYNHTNEADDANPYITSFRGIDNKVIVGFLFFVATCSII
jgi:hypothetical protein